MTDGAKVVSLSGEPVINRRKLIGSLSLILAAPAIVRVASLMPIKVWQDDGWSLGDSTHYSAEAYLAIGQSNYGGMGRIERLINQAFAETPSPFREKPIAISRGVTAVFDDRTGGFWVTYDDL